MDMTIEQLKELIKGVIADLKKEEAVKKVEEEIKTENEVHDDIVENLEEKKDAIESGVVQNSEPSKIQNQCDSVQNECGDKKTEVKNAEESDKSEVTEEVKAEVKEEIQEGKEEGKTKEEIKEEVKEEIAEEKEEEKKEKKEEVIKIEALNSAPTAFKDVSGKDKWMNLHGQEFWDYLAKHPEIKG